MKKVYFLNDYLGGVKRVNNKNLLSNEYFCLLRKIHVKFLTPTDFAPSECCWPS